MTVDIKLENFSGPLDLLLHLINSREMDIYDIRIGEITEQYLAVIDRMKQLDLDVAGEFLLMAAQLVHIKSRMLLPVSEDVSDEEGEDPRAELVKRLLEYQRYKEAGSLFDQMPQLDRDIFLPRDAGAEIFAEATTQDIDMTISVYQLANAFHLLMKNVKTEVFHEVVRESLSVADYMDKISRQMAEHSRMSFVDLFANNSSRAELIVTFLALLELIRMRLIRVEQVALFSDIWLTRTVSAEQMQHLHIVEEVLDYD